MRFIDHKPVMLNSLFSSKYIELNKVELFHLNTIKKLYRSMFDGNRYVQTTEDAATE